MKSRELIETFRRLDVAASEDGTHSAEGTPRGGTRPTTGSVRSGRETVVTLTIRCHGQGLLLFSEGRQLFFKLFFRGRFWGIYQGG